MERIFVKSFCLQIFRKVERFIDVFKWGFWINYCLWLVWFHEQSQVEHYRGVLTLFYLASYFLWSISFFHLSSFFNCVLYLLFTYYVNVSIEIRHLFSFYCLQSLVFFSKPFTILTNKILIVFQVTFDRGSPSVIQGPRLNIMLTLFMSNVFFRCQDANFGVLGCLLLCWCLVLLGRWCDHLLHFVLLLRCSWLVIVWKLVGFAGFVFSSLFL